ncbi:MAG TPA: arsenate reductase (glutaredoxin) [Nitrospirales bacterium]|jgi:arsenate reductase|nr:arsenate reductase (glutaredoxin) [Nitrospirales bacterium]HIA14723.1 arsenate reductase (glutaredoxin) [Nitrospirales bacterium]HIC04568.1 arsenate reductase (glutaredoxin) [Nitrospirales bacterium]HIN33248.1 arsenate reductase (glutaredoxin) [Nitrospirales bacterium]HIO22033.1 arsenate reductase (glutaredoxin) [Nitrospirales bacterium]
MTKTRIYHNPKCGKSRQTLALLQEKGITPDIVEYLKTPPTEKELDEILNTLGREPQEVMRTKEAAFKELGLKTSDSRSRKEWIALMVQNPILIERPIVIHGAKATLGRPPENVLKIL